MRETVAARLSPEIVAEISKRAEAEGRTRSQVMERLLSVALGITQAPPRLNRDERGAA